MSGAQRKIEIGKQVCILNISEMKNMFNIGEPGYLFWKKPEYFDYYYLGGLTFVLTDLIYLLFVYEMQSDFHLMLLHHSITLSLVVFSLIILYSYP